MSSGRVIPPGQVLPPMLTPDERAKQAQRQQAKDQPQNKPRRSGKTGERFAVLNQFVDVRMADLTRAQLVTWLTLYRDTRDGMARTSASDIARRGGLSRQSVQKAIWTLKKLGLLEHVYKGGLGRGLSIFKVQSE